MADKFILHLDEVSIDDIPEVGGKNASLGEMIGSLTKKGIRIPAGYAVTATAYKFFLSKTELGKYIETELNNLKDQDLDKLSEVSKKIREKFLQTPFPKELEQSIRSAHEIFEKKYAEFASFAVRSSATAEDLPTASFAGEHETYLNVNGIEEILIAVKKAMASLFTPRAISYRVEKGFKHLSVFLSVGVQQMVRSDMACSGVIFTLDTESGFSKVVEISGSWGLGEMVVQGKVTPDEFMVFKKTLGQNGNCEYVPIIKKKLGTKLSKMIYAHPGTKVLETTVQERSRFVLTDQEILTLAKWAVVIEKHYSEKNNRWTPMDLEWAKDGEDGELYIVQARPETIHSQEDFSKITEYVKKGTGKTLLTGASVGSKIATGKVNVINDSKQINKFNKGEILVTTITDPDWGPIMKLASAIVTDKGGRTSHAAIVARELGIPAVVGTGNATKHLKTGDEITVDTTGTDGIVYKGILDFEIIKHDVSKIPTPKTHIMVNIASPEIAFEKSFLPDSEKFSILPEKVENHNSAASLVNQFGPDLVIVFGARPLNKNFLKQISFPIVNHHGAILPYMRGLDSDAWLCFYRKFEYLGCSIHFVTPELDQGGIIATKGLELKKDIRFWMLRGYKAIAHADLAIGVLKNFEESVGKATVNNVSLGIYRSYAPWHVFYSAERNLRSYLERGVR